MHKHNKQSLKMKRAIRPSIKNEEDARCSNQAKKKEDNISSSNNLYYRSQLPNPKPYSRQQKGAGLNKTIDSSKQRPT